MWSRSIPILFAHSLQLASLGVASPSSLYLLRDNIQPSDFFDFFDFFTSRDPTNGFVQYVNRTYAEDNQLIHVYQDHVYIGVDHSNKFPTSEIDGIITGRPSVRIESRRRFTEGLFVLKLKHMPYGCGTWPAFWTYGQPWPQSGEIDIIEGRNNANYNLATLHTTSGCSIAGVNQTGVLLTSSCFTGDGANIGCSVRANRSTTYGKAFNIAGGGTYAMEWTSDFIRIWQWIAGKEPISLQSSSPDPSTFGIPLANFQGKCDISNRFFDHKLVFDITFCGDYAGATYESTSCPKIRGESSINSCISYVANNPDAFESAYWDIQSLHIYQQVKSSFISSVDVSKPSPSIIPKIESETYNLGEDTLMIAPMSISDGEDPSALKKEMSQAFPNSSSNTNSESMSDTTSAAPSSASSGAAIVLSAGPYVYQNCSNDYADFGSPLFGDGPINSDISSVEDCADWCYSVSTMPTGEAYVVFGVSAGSTCMCANQISNQGDSDQCIEPCDGNTSEICGGDSAVNVYVLGQYLSSVTFASPSSASGSIDTSVTYPTSPITSEPVTSSVSEAANTGSGSSGSPFTSIASTSDVDGAFSSSSSQIQTATAGSNSRSSTDVVPSTSASDITVNMCSTASSTGSIGTSGNFDSSSTMSLSVTLTNTSVFTTIPTDISMTDSSQSSTTFSPTSSMISTLIGTSMVSVSLPTSLNEPECNQYFEDNKSDSISLIYCNMALQAPDSSTGPVNDFISCINACAAVQGCVAAQFDNSTGSDSSGECALKASPSMTYSSATASTSIDFGNSNLETSTSPNLLSDSTSSSIPTQVDRALSRPKSRAEVELANGLIFIGNPSTYVAYMIYNPGQPSPGDSNTTNAIAVATSSPTMTRNVIAQPSIDRTHTITALTNTNNRDCSVSDAGIFMIWITTTITTQCGMQARCAD